MLSISQALVSARLRLIGAAPGRGRRVPLGPRDPELAEQVVAAFRDGASARAAAMRHGVNPHTALRWIRAAGYDTSKSAQRRRQSEATREPEKLTLTAA